jgi:hypothetical protein
LVFDHQWRLSEGGPVLGRIDSGRWGQFRADSLREASKADVALVDPNDHLYPLQLGQFTRESLSIANNWGPTYTFSATESRIKSILERSGERVRDYARRGGVRPGGWISFPLATTPPAVSGFSYTTSEEGLSTKGLSMDRSYLIAATEDILTQAQEDLAGPGYLGWLPDIKPIGINELDAQLAYLRK